MKNLKVYLSSTKNANPTDATLIRLYDCGNSGERYDQLLKIIDGGDPKAIGEYYDNVLSADEFDVEFECFQEGPIVPTGKMELLVRDEAQDKDVHSSTWTIPYTAQLLVENVDNLQFAEDFPDLLKQQIQDTIAKRKAENPTFGDGELLRLGVSECATYFPISQYRAENSEVTDDNLYVGVIMHPEMDNVEFEIQLDDKEKFDKKKMLLFHFIMGWELHHRTQYRTNIDVPLMLYGNTLYYGGLGDWRYEGQLFSIFRFKAKPESYGFDVVFAGDINTYKNNLKDSKIKLVDPFKVKDGVAIIPDGTEKIEKTLKGNTVLTSVVIPNSVTEIGDNAFEGCKNLTGIVIPDSVTKIGWCAFSDCTALTSIDIPHSVTKIASYAFRDCTGLTSIIIRKADTEMTIAEDTFMRCTKLKSAMILTPLKKLVLKDCSALETLTLCAGINKLDVNGTSLKVINVPAKKTDYYKKRLQEELHKLIVELPAEKKAKK